MAGPPTSAANPSFSAFAEARIVETRTNCRPALLDNQPLVDVAAGLVRINGLFRHGYLLAPALAERADLMEARKELESGG